MSNNNNIKTNKPPCNNNNNNNSSKLSPSKEDKLEAIIKMKASVTRIKTKI